MSVVPERPPAWTQEKISDRQRETILGLLDRKDLSRTPEGQINTLFKCLCISEDAEEFGMSKGSASRVISWLLTRDDKPKEQRNDEHLDGVFPDGYYALRMDGHKNDLTFYRLNTGKAGTRWEGYQFIDMVVGHGKRFPQKGPIVRAKIYQTIKEQGADEARKLYGQEIGRCGRCGRELTDQTSRAFGIGPDCRDLMGL